MKITVVKKSSTTVKTRCVGPGMVEPPPAPSLSNKPPVLRRLRPAKRPQPLQKCAIA